MACCERLVATAYYDIFYYTLNLGSCHTVAIPTCAATVASPEHGLYRILRIHVVTLGSGSLKHAVAAFSAQPLAKLLARAGVSGRSVLVRAGSKGVGRPRAPTNGELPNVPAGKSNICHAGSN